MKREPLPRFTSFSTLEQAHIAQRLAFLLRSGMSLHESLSLLIKHTGSPKKQKILAHITKGVESGLFLSSSLEASIRYFNPLTITIIRIGEHTGTLSENLSYLAHELGKRHALKRKIQGALIYPCFITLVTLVVTGTLIMFIFPKLMPIFQSLNVPLPFLTQTLLAMSTFLTQYWIHLTALVISAFLTVTLFQRYITGFRRLTDTLLLHVPFLRRLIMLYNGTQFCRTLRLTLHAGLSLSEGVHITEEITPNMRYRDVYASLRKHILQGEKMSLTLFRHTHLFPPMLPEMIETAENSGSLSDTLGYLSEFYEAELDDATKNLSNSLEPILLIIMGLTVGLIAVAVITPLYEITRSMQRY